MGRISTMFELQKGQFKKDREALTSAGISLSHLCKLGTDTGLSPLLCEVLKSNFPLISWSWWKTQESWPPKNLRDSERTGKFWRTGIIISHLCKPGTDTGISFTMWSFEVHLSIDLMQLVKPPVPSLNHWASKSIGKLCLELESTYISAS